MNLKSKKNLASKALKVGIERVKFEKDSLAEIKEAITKEDMRALKEEGAISIIPVKGRKTNVKRRNPRGTGKIKKKVNVRKRNYVIMTRKLRSYVKGLKSKGVISKEEVKEIRKKIRNKAFKSQSNLKSYIGEIRK